jgi:uncharacterized SAM-binding protein YcdF (DUF218 family)
LEVTNHKSNKEVKSPRLRVSASPRFLLIVFLSLFLAWILFAWFLAWNLIVEKPLERADAILILSGSSVYVERTQKAALVYKQGVAPKILLTDDGGRAGWSKSERRNPKFVEAAQNNLIAEGVPAENIEIIAVKVSGTIEEAEALRDKINQTHWKTVLIVTSAYHTRRSLWTFEKVLENENVQIGIVSPPTGEQTPSPFVWWLTVKGWSLVAGEYVKILYYRLNY